MLVEHSEFNSNYRVKFIGRDLSGLVYNNIPAEYCRYLFAKEISAGDSFYDQFPNSSICANTTNLIIDRWIDFKLELHDCAKVSDESAPYAANDTCYDT